MVALGVLGRRGRVEFAIPLAVKSSSSVEKDHAGVRFQEFVSSKHELQIWNTSFISSVATVNSTLTK